MPAEDSPYTLDGDWKDIAMERPTLDDVQALPDFLTSNRFYMEFSTNAKVDEKRLVLQTCGVKHTSSPTYDVVILSVVETEDQFVATTVKELWAQECVIRAGIVLADGKELPPFVHGTFTLASTNMVVNSAGAAPLIYELMFSGGYLGG